MDDDGACAICIVVMSSTLGLGCSPARAITFLGDNRTPSRHKKKKKNLRWCLGTAILTPPISKILSLSRKRGVEERPDVSPPIQINHQWNNLHDLFFKFHDDNDGFLALWLEIFFLTTVIMFGGITGRIVVASLYGWCLDRSLHGCLISSHFSTSHSHYSSLNGGSRFVFFHFPFLSSRYVTLHWAERLYAPLKFVWLIGKEEGKF